MSKIVFTCGDINGIGPEIVLKCINRVHNNNCDIIFSVPQNIFERTLKVVDPEFEYKIVNDRDELKKKSDKVLIYNLGIYTPSIGKPTKLSGKAAYSSIKTSFELVNNGVADAMVTAPISKTAIQMAGVNFPGHTELLANWSETKDFVMTFLSEEFNTALLTIHEPISNVSGLITKRMLKKKLEVLISMLKNDLNCSSPKIALLALNPHAGENGLIGDEEERVFKPFIKSLRDADVEGPFVADAFFANKLYRHFDLVIGAYHDQVLIPFKLLNFNKGTNYTAGLPIIRTSPDHGTAFDIAGNGIADEQSLVEAFNWAMKISDNRKASSRN